jgi:hypothetical protein
MQLSFPNRFGGIKAKGQTQNISVRDRKGGPRIDNKEKMAGKLK